MSTRRGAVLLGGASSGKSTWLGALLNGIEAGGTPFLKRGTLPDDISALDALVAPLVEDARYPEPSAQGPAQPIEIPLRTTGRLFQPGEFVLSTADYSGHLLQQVFADRTGLSDAWKEMAGYPAFLLFLHPQLAGVTGDPSESSLAPTWETFRDGKQSTPPPGPQSSPLYATRHDEVFPPVSLEEVARARPGSLGAPLQPPAALDLIEMLQIIRHERELSAGERPARGSMRIAVILSAWDSVPEGWQRKGPPAVLSRQYALLEEFLWSNFHADDVYRFGVSATGGDLKDPVHRERYRERMGGFVEFKTPHGVVRTTDLSVPLLWLLEGDRALETGTAHAAA